MQNYDIKLRDFQCRDGKKSIAIMVFSDENILTLMHELTWTEDDQPTLAHMVANFDALMEAPERSTINRKYTKFGNLYISVSTRFLRFAFTKNKNPSFLMRIDTPTDTGTCFLFLDELLSYCE